MAARSIIKQVSRTYLLADQDGSVSPSGGYFIASNTTPGTALAFGVNASYDVTKNLFLFYNTSSVQGNPVRMYMDYIKILPTVAPASGTSLQIALQLDYVNRYTSGAIVIGAGGTQAAVNVNGDSAVGPVGACYAATGGVVITSPAAGSQVRKLGRCTPRNVIPAVLEEIVLSFGSAGDAGTSSATTAGRSSTNLPPVIIGPQQWLVVTAYSPSNSATGLSYEFECAWAEA